MTDFEQDIATAVMIRQVEEKTERRERIAVACLSGLLANTGVLPSSIIARDAVEMSDLLIRELDQKETK